MLFHPALVLTKLTIHNIFIIAVIFLLIWLAANLGETAGERWSITKRFQESYKSGGGYGRSEKKNLRHLQRES